MLLRRFPAILALCLLPTAFCRAAIDFTPRYADIQSDGIFSHSLYLQDGPKRIFLRAPLKWDVKGEGGSLCLTSAEHPTCRVDIRGSAVKLPLVMDDAWVKTLTPQLLKSLPAGAENGAIVDAKPNTITLNSWKSFEVRISFEMAKVKYLRSVCFITLVDNESIEMVVGASEADLGTARSAGVALLSSWLEPPVKVMNRMLQMQ